MKDIIDCVYSSSNIDIFAAEKNSYIIVQVLCESGQIIVGNNTYPITYGSIYFIDGKDQCRIITDNMQNFAQNSITLAKDFIENLASSLDCTDDINDIFAKGCGLYVPIKHYKTIAARFKNMANLFKSEKLLSKALLVSELIPLFNYAMHAKAKH